MALCMPEHAAAAAATVDDRARRDRACKTAYRCPHKKNLKPLEAPILAAATPSTPKRTVKASLGSPGLVPRKPWMLVRRGRAQEQRPGPFEQWSRPLLRVGRIDDVGRGELRGRRIEVPRRHAAV